MEPQYMYQVMREVDEGYRHNYEVSHTECRGTYWTLKEANKAAKKDLLQEWDQDFFDEYEVTKDNNGMVRVHAVCGEGETMSVYVERARAPPGKVPPRASTAVSSQLGAAVGRDKYVYMIIVTRFEHHEDEEGRASVNTDAVYESLVDANDSALEILLEECGADSKAEIEDLHESIDQEKEMGEYRARAELNPAYVGDTWAVEVEVKKVRVQLAGGGGSKKRERDESEEDEDDDDDSEDDDDDDDDDEPPGKRARQGSPEVIEILSD